MSTLGSDLSYTCLCPDGTTGMNCETSKSKGNSMKSVERDTMYKNSIIEHIKHNLEQRCDTSQPYIDVI